jgi:hypothetical protein
LSIHELQQIRRAFQGLQTLYQTHLPKVDSGLIHDLLIRELNKKSDDRSTLPPFYIVEIRTTERTDQETMKSMIFEKTGFLPSITENGTLYVANMRLSLGLPKEMCESRQGIVRITGDYTGGIGGR